MNKFLTKPLCAAILGGVACVGSMPANALTTIDLTGGGAQTHLLVTFGTSEPKPTGAGVFNVFLSVQNVGLEDGFNADARPVMPDVKTSLSNTHDVILQDIGGEIEDEKLFVFLQLDLNESNNPPNDFLSLDSFQVRYATSPISAAGAKTDFDAHGTLVYDLDSAGDTTILLKDVTSGSGQGDMFVRIPWSLFADLGATPTDYLYLYSKFGEQMDAGDANGYGGTSTQEEWAHLTRSQTFPGPGDPVPETSTWIAAAGIAGIAGLSWRRARSRARA